MNQRVNSGARVSAPRVVRALAERIGRLIGEKAGSALWCAGLGAALVLAVGIALSAALNIWLDEAFTMHTTGAGIGMAWMQSVRFEDQPPLYFLIEAAWRLWDQTSITFARMPSVLFAALAVAVIVGAAHRMAPRTPPLLVALIAAVHPVILWAAVEMRVYALVLLIGAVLTWSFFEGFLVARPSRNARIVYVVAALAGLYTQYFVGFVLVAHGLTLLALRRRGLCAFVGLMLIVAAGFAPFVPVALAQVHSPGDSIGHATLGAATHAVVNVAFAYALPHDLGWSGAFKLLGFGTAASLALAFGVAGRPAFANSANRGIFLELGFALAIFSAVFAVVGMPFDLVRHLIVLVPATLLALCVGVSSLRRMRLLGAALTAAVVGAFAATQLAQQYPLPLAKQGDWQRVAAVLAADDGRAPIAVFPAELALPLRAYTPVATIAIPRPMPFELDYVAATALTDVADVARVLEPVRARSERIWVVTENLCRPADIAVYDYHCRFLEAYLTHRYRLEKTVLFRGTVARRYVRAGDSVGDSFNEKG